MKKLKSAANHTLCSRRTLVMSQSNRPPKLSKIKNDRTYSWKMAPPTNKLTWTWSNNPWEQGCNSITDSNRGYPSRCSTTSISSTCSTRRIWCPNSKIVRLSPHSSKWWTCRPSKSSICNLNLCLCPNNLPSFKNRFKPSLCSTYQRRAFTFYRLKVKI